MVKRSETSQESPVVKEVQPESINTVGIIHAQQHNAHTNLANTLNKLSEFGFRDNTISAYSLSNLEKMTLKPSPIGEASCVARSTLINLLSLRLRS